MGSSFLSRGLVEGAWRWLSLFPVEETGWAGSTSLTDKHRLSHDLRPCGATISQKSCFASCSLRTCKHFYPEKCKNRRGNETRDRYWEQIRACLIKLFDPVHTLNDFEKWSVPNVNSLKLAVRSLCCDSCVSNGCINSDMYGFLVCLSGTRGELPAGLLWSPDCFWERIPVCWEIHWKAKTHRSTDPG